MDQGRVIGQFTLVQGLSYYRRYCPDCAPDPEHATNLAQWMAPLDTTILEAESWDLWELTALFQRHGRMVLPVVREDGALVGVIHQRTVQEVLQSTLADLSPPDPEAYQLVEEELLQNKLALQANQHRLDSILSSIDDVVWSVAADTKQLLFLNTAAQHIFGRPIGEFLEDGKLWETIIHPEDRDRVAQSEKLLERANDQDQKYRIVWPNGTVRWVRTRSHLVRDEQGAPLRIDGITSDITESQAIQEKLRHDALYDSLTGLANRNLLLDRLEQALKHHRRHLNKSIAILFLDLDRFKLINESLGYQNGDRLLIAVANRFQSCRRSVDTISRFGGDEFIILLEELDQPDDALRVSERLHQSLLSPFVLDGQEVHITASIGITISMQTQPLSEWDEMISLLRDAETAMYRAKAQGQGSHEVFNPAMHLAAVNQLQLENDLRRAVTNALGSQGNSSEFVVYYQPIVSLSDKRIQGFEALIRWQHPTRGLIPPDQFIPLAEETGLIIGIDHVVLRSACQQLKQLQDHFPALGPLIMSINLSGRHFSGHGLIEWLKQILAENQLEGKFLKLEITETVLIQNFAEATTLLDRLAALDIQVCLDDFGTGYSSLSYLNAFPFDTLKIDRSFVSRMGTPSKTDDKCEIIRAIVNLGRTLGLKVVAEGVETPEQAAELALMDCHYGQGYCFAKPMPPPLVVEYCSAAVQGL
jgi:diguanylate cyclase (GGDEF)-like protein/PAS domain S-box-containing protein